MTLITLTQSESTLYVNIDKISTFYTHKSPGGGVSHNSCVIIEGVHYYVMESVGEIEEKLVEVDI